MSPSDEAWLEVQRELLAVAARLLRESPRSELEPGDLVGRAWLAILSGPRREQANRDPRSVVALAVVRMRRELVEEGRLRGRRRRLAEEHGIEDAPTEDVGPEDLVEAQRLLDRIRAEQAGHSRIVLMWVEGRSEREIEAETGVSNTTVARAVRSVLEWLRSLAPAMEPA